MLWQQDHQPQQIRPEGVQSQQQPAPPVQKPDANQTATASSGPAASSDSGSAAPNTSNQSAASDGSDQVRHPGATNVLKPAQIALAAQKAGFSGKNLVTAVAVAIAESSGDADVVNRSHAYGLWQVLAAAHPDLIRSSDPDASRWFDPYTNAKFAWEISSEGKDWTPWQTYTTGAYRTYMGDARVAVDLLASNPQSVAAPTVS